MKLFHSKPTQRVYPRTFHPLVLLVIAALLLSVAWVMPSQTVSAATNADPNAVPSGVLNGAVSTAYWQGEYFNNPTLTGAPALLRTTRAIAYKWGLGSPDYRVQSDNFSARWTRRVYFAPGLYRLRTVADDGARVYVDDQLVLDGWSDGPVRTTEVDLSLSGTRVVRVEYYDRTQYASISFSYSRIGAAQAQAPWRGEYYNNTTLTGAPTLVRNDAQINFNWNNGSPDRRIRADEFSARWTRRLSAPQGNYTINVRVDDGVRVYVDGNLVIDQWQDGPPRSFQATVFMRNQSSIRVEYFDRAGGAQIQVVIVPGGGTQPAPTPLPNGGNGSYPQWRSEYYSNPDLAGSPVLVRNDLTINFTWGAGSPDGRVPSDNFSVRWTGVPKLNPGFYRINLNVDDGARVFVNNQIVIDGWVEGALRGYGANITVGNSFPEVRVEYFDRGGHAQIQVSFTPISDPNQQPTSFPDWKGEYFNNISLDGNPTLLRNDGSINFDWTNTSPDPRIRTTDFSVRWSRQRNFTGGLYRFDMSVDDGMRVWIDGRLVFDEWFDASRRDRSVQVDVTSGDHDLRVDYYQRGGGAIARFNIVKLDPTATVVPTLTPLPIVPTATPIP